MQKIVPDGCIEMTFNFGDTVKRYFSETEFILHHYTMGMVQRTKSINIFPVGNVDTFAICFYPIGFAYSMKTSIAKLINKSAPITELFEQTEAYKIELHMVQAIDTKERIDIIKTFLKKTNRQNCD